MIRRLFSLHIPGSGTWPVEENEILDVVASEDTIISRAARLAESRVLVWSTPFEDVIVAPDRLRDMIAEIRLALPPEPTLDEASAAQRVTDFLNRARDRQDYVRIVDTN